MSVKYLKIKMDQIRKKIRTTLGTVTLTDFTEELLDDRKYLFEQLEICLLRLEVSERNDVALEKAREIIVHYFDSSFYCQAVAREWIKNNTHKP